MPPTPAKPQTIPPVFMLRGHPVMLAAHAARAFEVQTREVVQNITRNPDKFPEKYAFQISPDERTDLTSLGVIPKPGRGGSRALPWVVTQKGAIRLATLMNAPRAIEAADLFIDVFSEVLTQLYAGKSRVTVPNPARLTSDAKTKAQVARLRDRLFDAMDDLLDTVIDSKHQTTVRDELSDLAGGARSQLHEWLKSRKLGNDQTEASTLLVLEQVRDLFERRQSALADAELNREARSLDNLQKKITIVRDLGQMLDNIEPSAVVDLLGGFAPASPRIMPPPKKEK